MGTKSTNRYLILFILCCLIFVFSIICVKDIIINKSNFNSNNSLNDSNISARYTNSNEFRSEVSSFMINIVELNTTYKDFDSQSYSQKDAKYEAYSQIVDQVKLRLHFQYYLIDKKTKKVYTNIQNVSNINKYIRDKSLYYINFDKCEDTYGEMMTDYNDVARYSFDKFEAYFIIPKMIKGIDYFVDSIVASNSINKPIDPIKDRVKKEKIIVPITMTITVGLYIFLFHFKGGKIAFISSIKKIYKKILIDLRIIAFIFVTVILNQSYGSIDFFKPLMASDYLEVVFASLYAMYIIIIIQVVFKGNRENGEFQEECKKSIIFKTLISLEDSMKIKSVLAKTILVFILTFIFAAKLIPMCNQYYYTRRLPVYDLLLAIVYISFVPFYIINRIAYVNKIINGSKEIASGDFKHEIPVSDKSVLGELANNINNIKKGYEKSIEDKIKSERFKAELITNVSHDLKTPLTSIITYVGLLKKDNLAVEEKKEYLDVLDKKTQRLKVLIEDIFEVSKITSGAVELKIEKVDVAAMMKQTLGEFDEKIMNSNLDFKLNFLDSNIFAFLDGNKTYRVFENLLNNILKYSHAHTRVYIDMFDSEEKITIIMKNIAAYEMDFTAEEMFERFKRGDKSRNTEGNGLGLAIAKSIVELENGTLNIQIDGDLFKVIIEFYKGVGVEG